MRLYRDSLKLARSWCVDRGVFNEEATRIQVHYVYTCACKVHLAEKLSVFRRRRCTHFRSTLLVSSHVYNEWHSKLCSFGTFDFRDHENS